MQYSYLRLKTHTAAPRHHPPLSRHEMSLRTVVASTDAPRTVRASALKLTAGNRIAISCKTADNIAVAARNVIFYGLRQ
ncbi:MAG TPA: hypothetical protein VFX61_03380 [Micromonosporaceae bacterium]|nr:hypothetical protein [Micromonosporaceae bacterium]